MTTATEPTGSTGRSSSDDRAQDDQARAVAALPRVSVVIPTLNEARNLEHVFAALPGGLHEVILVDGNSTDGTPDVARALRPDIRIVGQSLVARMPVRYAEFIPERVRRSLGP